MNIALRCLTFASMGAALVACGESDTFVPPASSSVTNGVMTVDSADFVEEAHLYVHGCEVDGTGRALGDLAGNFTYMNCEGDPVRLHDYCGRRDAMLVVGSAGWCGACIAHYPEVTQRTQELRSQGLETFIFVGETTDYQGVTLEWCQDFATTHGVDPAMMIFDPDNADGLNSLWNYIAPNGGMGGTIGLPWDAVLDPSDMEIIWEGSTGPWDTVDALLEE